MECEGDSIDLSGDVGAVGRIIVSDGPSGNHEMLLDLKGIHTCFSKVHLPNSFKSRSWLLFNMFQTM